MIRYDQYGYPRDPSNYHYSSCDQFRNEGKVEQWMKSEQFQTDSKRDGLLKKENGTDHVESAGTCFHTQENTSESEKTAGE